MTKATDLAEARHRYRWIHHPVLGDPSWDSFAREPGNPIYTGTPPMEWPVNGYLFEDPASGRWYAYVGLYPRGYFPCGDSLAMRERDDGRWEEAGIAVGGDAALFDGEDGKPGFAPDVSVVFADGRYHMVYDWGTKSMSRNGIAYAWADRPEGPFVRHPVPIHVNVEQAPVLGRYRRTYAATIVRRTSDWMVLAMMDGVLPGHGAWALACLLSDRPEGPYTKPSLLLYPQSEQFHPPTMEFYPAFVHDGSIFAPATSVARNRSFQMLYRAPIEEAHEADAWHVHQLGSMWHAEDAPHEAQGIWGQTFSGQVTRDGVLRVLFPSKTAGDVGTINISHRRWDEPFKDGFVLSAPNAAALAITRLGYGKFALAAEARTDGSWALCWDCTGPLGPSSLTSDAIPHERVRTSRTELRLSASGWGLFRLGPEGTPKLVATGPRVEAATRTDLVEVERDGDTAGLRLRGEEVWRGTLPGGCGRLELLAETGTILRVDRLEVRGQSLTAVEPWLATEALVGAGANPDHWRPVEDPRFRYGFGYVSASPDAHAKWNVFGQAFRLLAPRGPSYGTCKVSVDGVEVALLDLCSAGEQTSDVVLEQAMPEGMHAVSVRPFSGAIPCDVLELVHPA